MKKYTISAAKRDMTGRKVKSLRKAGQLPATIYGKNIKSLSITVPTADFLAVYKEAGESGLVEIVVDKQTRPTLIHTVQYGPVTRAPLHAEFYQVDLKEKVHANVPIEFSGESAAVRDKQGVLLTIMDEVEVEALPTNLPENIAVDLSILDVVDSEIKVKDLVAPSGVTIETDGELTVAKIGPLVTKEAEAQAKEEEAQAAQAVTEGGEAPETTEPTGEASAPTDTKEDSKPQE